MPFTRIRTSNVDANSSYNVANLTIANSGGYVQFYDGSRLTTANTDYTTISTSAGVYGNANTITVITLAANGRISGITNTAIQTATTSVNGIVQLNDTITSTSTSQAATANAAKLAYTTASADAVAFAIALG